MYLARAYYALHLPSLSSLIITQIQPFIRIALIAGGDLRDDGTWTDVSAHVAADFGNLRWCVRQRGALTYATSDNWDDFVVSWDVIAKSREGRRDWIFGLGLEKKDDAYEEECLARLLGELGLKNGYDHWHGWRPRSEDVNAGLFGSDYVNKLTWPQT
jgi:hypothetical protein